MRVGGGIGRTLVWLVVALLVLPLSIVTAAGTTGTLGARPPAVALAQDSGYGFSQGDPGCNRVALIFNIGAGSDPATSILDTLVNDGVPATMFLMGWWANQYPDLVNLMVADGFTIGNHGNLPPELTLRSDDDVASDLATAAAAVQQVSGVWPGPWFTPYAGAVDDRVRAIASSEGFVTVGWHVDSGDWTPDATPDSVYNNVVGNVYDGAIVELHLDSPNSAGSTAVALPWIIDDLRSQGYQFVTVDQMAQPC